MEKVSAEVLNWFFKTKFSITETMNRNPKEII